MFAGAKRSPAHNRPWLYCPARERSMAVRPPDRERNMTAQALGRRHSTAPLVQRGDSMAKPCKGGLTALNCLDDTSCQVWDLVAGCPQSLSRRSPTAPFAQGSRLCGPASNQPQFLLPGAAAPPGCSVTLVPCRDSHTFFALARCACLGKESMTAQALGLPSAAAQYGCGGSPPAAQYGCSVTLQGE